MNEETGLKSIFNISDYKFIIKNYQRGYRWDSKQVENLLDDLLEFEKSNNELYCLQPIIVRKLQENEYELIDGQQRLTTIYILLKFLQTENIYKIEYETREKSEEFLENINNMHQENINNLDFLFMKNAYETIKKWFEITSQREETGALKARFSTLLLDNKRNVKFIWYEIKDPNISSEEVFSRINVGKIALSDAELIKAKLLFDVKTEEKEEKYLKQLEIGNEWDMIEKDLQNDMMWRFLVNYKKEKTNRIEYIFDYISNYISKKEKDNEDYYTFNEDYYTFETISNLLDEKLKNKDKFDYDEKEFWNRYVKKYYLIFKEWYSDVELYNFIGFMNFYNIKDGNTYKLIEKYERCVEKTEFKHYVKKLIIKDTKDIVDNLDTLDYEEDYEKLKKILILFNVISMNKMQEKFPFNKYKKEEWSLEHIHPRNIKNIGKDKSKWKILCEDEIKTLKDILEQFYSKKNDEKYKLYNDILNKMEKLKDSIEMMKSEDEFKYEFEKISSLMEDEYGVENINTIANLTLLDKDTNSRISNNYFDTKRRELIKAEKEGLYIPICTKNVFLKFYSKNPNHIYFWTNEDRRDYRNAMEKDLQEFVGSESE